MNQQGGKPSGHEDDWWGQLYDDTTEDTGPTATPDSLDDRFASAAGAVEGRAASRGAAEGGIPAPRADTSSGVAESGVPSPRSGDAGVVDSGLPGARPATAGDPDDGFPAPGSGVGAGQRAPGESPTDLPPGPGPATFPPGPTPPESAEQPPPGARTAPDQPPPPGRTATPTGGRISTETPTTAAPASRTPPDVPPPPSAPPSPPPPPPPFGPPPPIAPPARADTAAGIADEPEEDGVPVASTPGAATTPRPTDPVPGRAPWEPPHTDPEPSDARGVDTGPEQNGWPDASTGEGAAAPLAEVGGQVRPDRPPEPAAGPADAADAPSPVGPADAADAPSPAEPAPQRRSWESRPGGESGASQDAARASSFGVAEPSAVPHARNTGADAPPQDAPPSSRTATRVDLPVAPPRPVGHVGSGPPTYEAEPTALPPADPDDLDDLVADTVLDGARYGTSTLRAASVRGDSARFRGEPRRDSLLTARFGTGEHALVLVAMATGARATPGAHRAAAEACHWIGRAVGRSHARLAEDIRAGRRGELKSGLHRLTDRSLGKLRASAAEQGIEPEEYAAALRCLLLPADPQCRTRVFFGVGPGGLFRLRDGEWQDIEPRVTDVIGDPVVGFGSLPAETPEGDRLTMDLGIPTPPSPYEPAPEPPREPFRFRASVARPGDTLLMCTGGLAEPLRGEPELCGYLTGRWSGPNPPGLAEFLADAQVRVKGYADDRTAAAVWEA
ncbi:protein phosphatase 2C domain-containing protein [Streptomyces sp. NPDC006602]|uniref:protein phosphatase 2C domain-containing protein n=1 Tax=Streptomyces sp. NPDC006602 TaxID=3364751 RepID=UPI00368B8BE5